MARSRALPHTLRILIVDRDAESRSILRRALEARIRRPLAVVETDDCALAPTMDGPVDALAIDLSTSGSASSIATLIARTGAVATFVLGAPDAVRDAVAAVRAGAEDFIEKPLDGDTAARRIERRFVEAEAAAAGSVFEGMIGRSTEMRSLFRDIQRVAPTGAPVMIFADPGTGSSSVAAAVHARSRRRDGPFVEIGCGEIGGDDARLFGAGGALDRADGGTLHLSNVDRLDRRCQKHVAGFLDGGEIGGDGAARRRPSVRLIASARPGAAGPGDGPGLGPDLHFRLSVLTLVVPTLAARRDDVPALADAMLRRAARDLHLRPARLSAEAGAVLSNLPLTGNLHELAAMASRIASLAPGETIDPDRLADAIGLRQPSAPIARRSLQHAGRPAGFKIEAVLH